MPVELRAYIYGVNTYDNTVFDEREHTTFSPSVKITRDEAAHLSALGVGDNFILPPAMTKLLQDSHAPGNPKLDYSQIARIEICGRDEAGQNLLVRFFVDGVTREGKTQPNHWRPYDASDSQWATVDQLKDNQGSGVFVQSGNFWERETGSEVKFDTVILRPHDRIVRLIGEDFRIIDSAAESKIVPRAAAVLNR